MGREDAETMVLRRAQAAAANGEALDEGLRSELDQLFDSYRPRLIALCTRWIQDERRGEELAHDAIAVAWSKLDTLAFEGSFLHFLSAIARNLARNAKRKVHEHLTEDGLVEVGSEEHGALAILRDDEQERVLLEAIADLPQKEQDAIYLRYYEGLSDVEINERLALDTRSGARGLLVTARRHLQGRLRTALLSLGHGSSFFRTTEP